MSQIYFLHAPSVNLIKIGCSADPERRFGELRLLSPVPLDVIGVMDGGSAEEASLHRQFAHLNDHGEWFHATSELLGFAQTECLMCAWKNACPEVREWFLDEVGLHRRTA